MKNTRKTKDQLIKELEILQRRTSKLEDLEAQHQEMEEERKHNYDIQTVVNSLLILSLENISLKELLSQTLDLIISIPWLVLVKKGSIFVIDQEFNDLVMEAENGISEATRKQCYRVPVGQCLCGMAAQTKEIQFVDRVDDLHSRNYKGIDPHGHYCVPVIYNKKVLGVLNLYVREGHERNQEEEDFLMTMASTLAGMIERKNEDETIKRLAFSDVLTGLPNRQVFYDRLNLAMAHAYRSKHQLAVMFLDLDRFKDINDSLGHMAGDKLLQHVAHRLTNLLRRGDTVARMGGDEFILILPEIGGADNIDRIAKKIIRVFREPFVFDGNRLHVTTSIGVAVYSDDGEDVDALLRNADIALYDVKKHGRNNYRRYVHNMEAISLRMMSREQLNLPPT